MLQMLICEGEIHGLYNLYIDGVPLICTDANDADVRSATSTTANADGTRKRDDSRITMLRQSRQ